MPIPDIVERARRIFAELNKAKSSEQSKQTGSLEPAGTASNSQYGLGDLARDIEATCNQAADEASWNEAVRDGTREANTSYLQESPEDLNATEARDPHDHPPPPRYANRTFPIVTGILFLIMLAGGGLLCWHYATQNSAYINAYSALGDLSKLSVDAATSGTIRKPLEQLIRERCDRQAIFDLGEALENAGYRREAASAHVNFSEICGGDEPSLRRASNIMLELSDYAGAATVASAMITLEPLYDNGYYLRALAHDRGGLAEKAIDDYITTLELVGNKDNVIGTPYFNMARLYEKLGRFCDAVVPIEAWVSLNPAHDTSQTRAIIGNDMTKGRCATETTGGVEAFPISRPNQVINLPVTVNGVPGMFVLDTGATFVSIKNSFAQKADVKIERDSIVYLHTGNGIVEGKRGRANKIQLRSLLAKDVPIVVNSTGAYGDAIDGLLGMSFLSRFDIKIDTRSVKISTRH